MQHDPGQSHAAEPIPRLALRSREAAAALGISEGTLATWRAERGLPHVRHAQLILYPVGALRQWLDREAQKEDRGGSRGPKDPLAAAQQEGSAP